MNQVPALPANCCTTPEARLSYANLYKPAPDLNGVLKFGVTLLMPKATSDITEINAAMAAAVQKGIKDKWNGIQPVNIAMAVKDGDVYCAQKPEKRQMYIGMWYIVCKQNPEYGQPIVLNEHRVRSEDETEVQSGDYAVAVVEFVPYSTRGNDGITTIPKVVRKIRTGERFGGGVSTSDAIAAVGGEVPAEQGAALQQQQQATNTQPGLHPNPGAVADVSSIF